MTLQEFESKLSAKELQEFKENLAKNPKNWSYGIFIKSRHGFGDAISSAFMWYGTTQGFDYWSKISQR